MLVSSGQNACAQITAASCLSRVVKAPVLKLRPFISLVLSVPKDKYLEGRLFFFFFFFKQATFYSAITDITYNIK